MCVLIHKPAGLAVPADLLKAILSLNQDGWGLMGFMGEHIVVEKHGKSKIALIEQRLHDLQAAELAIHLRQRTRGHDGESNAHPFRIDDHTALMHNGTLRLPVTEAGRSDTWHFVQNVLRPLSGRYAGLLTDPAFLQLLEMALQPENKVVFFDQKQRQLHWLNRQHGIEFEGLWLSNTRWIDRRILPLRTPQSQERTLPPEALQFI
jgi:hypothetical protein